MAYVDHTFSITDEDDEEAFEGAFIAHNRFPLKDVALSVLLLVSGFMSVVLGLGLVLNKNAGHRAPGVFFTVFGCLLFLPGLYYTRIAYYAYKGYKGFTFTNMPNV